MKILIVGGGGREHALAWKINQSPKVGKIFAVPGNGGLAGVAECRPDLPADARLVDWALEQGIDLAVIGPEGPLAAGLSDAFEAAGLRVFGPSGAAARLEGSKSYAKEIMKAAGVPTGASAVFDHYGQAAEYLCGACAPYVIKADGLAAGKGVIIVQTLDEAKQALRDCLLNRRFGGAGSKVVIEEFLSGPEVSVLAFVDGRNIKLMPPAQDYKRIGDDDTGPNTGGMGCYAPVPFVDEALLSEARERIIRPVVEELASRGVAYKGVLYAGLILTDAGPKVLEFNARFGDPETEVILPLLDSDLVEIIEACIDGTLDQVEPVWSPKKCLTVILASEGYPESVKTGREITGLDRVADTGAIVFHAGTCLQDDKVMTSGGRVIAVSTLGDSFGAARDKAYEAVDLIQFAGRRFRTDIGKRVTEVGVK